MSNHPEQQYLDLISKIITEGSSREDRTGVGTKSIWGATMRFDLQKGFPLFTTRFIAARIAIEEMLFFLRGETDTKKLEEKNIKIWQGNTTREFLDKRGLTNLQEGEMGYGYGHQIRNFNGSDNMVGFDQLKYLVDNIKNNPNDRRHLMSYWNPLQVLDQAALPPCHLLLNCQVVDGKINGIFYMRSSDVYHGLPYNVVGYAFVLHLLAKLTGYEVGELVYMGADCHIYNSQMEVIEELLQRNPKSFPTFSFKKEFSTLEEAVSLTFDDLEIVGYEHCGKLKTIPMAV